MKYILKGKHYFNGAYRNFGEGSVVDYDGPFPGSDWIPVKEEKKEKPSKKKEPENPDKE